VLPIGWVKEIWRYPRQGMAGEMFGDGQRRRTSESLAIGVGGPETARREIQSCKRHPNLLLCTASYLKARHVARLGRLRYDFLMAMKSPPTIRTSIGA